MTSKERIHAYLDGELPLEALSAEERLEGERYGASLEPLAAAAAVGTPGDLTDPIMRRIALLHTAAQPAKRRARTGLRVWAAWLWRPRSITLRPALAVAGLVLYAAGAALLAAGEPDEAAVDPPRVFVQFRLDVADVERVALAGDFTGWKPLHELHQSGPGVWSVTIALEPGVHDYAFVLDGERWVSDPMAAAVDDGFGGVNSRVAVLVPERRRSS